MRRSHNSLSIEEERGKLERASKELFYDPLTGLFTWRTKRKNGVPAGRVAGRLSREGYIEIQLSKRYPGGRDYESMAAHRLAWFIYYGEVPEGDLDHINHDRKDNRIINLRVMEDSRMNSQNLKCHDEKLWGVSFNKHRNKYYAKFRYQDGYITGGFHSTMEEAHQASVKRAIELGIPLLERWKKSKK